MQCDNVQVIFPLFMLRHPSKAASEQTQWDPTQHVKSRTTICSDTQQRCARDAGIKHETCSRHKEQFVCAKGPDDAQNRATLLADPEEECSIAFAGGGSNKNKKNCAHAVYLLIPSTTQPATHRSVSQSPRLAHSPHQMARYGEAEAGASRQLALSGRLSSSLWRKAGRWRPRVSVSGASLKQQLLSRTSPVSSRSLLRVAGASLVYRARPKTPSQLPNVFFFDLLCVRGLRGKSPWVRCIERELSGGAVIQIAFSPPRQPCL